MDVWWKAVDGTQERQLVLPGIQTNPSVSGDLVVFESEFAPNPNI